MEAYGSRVGLSRFRRDAIHREAMCIALGEEDAAYMAIAASVRASIDIIDARSAVVRGAEDLFVRARALEVVRKLRAVKSYTSARKELETEAMSLVRTLLPVAPSTIGKAGIKRARALLETALASLRSDAIPEAVRTEHVPAVEREIARLKEADEAEDSTTAALAAVHGALVVWRGERERDRVSQFGDLAKLIKDRSQVDAFFLPAYVRDDEAIEETATATPGAP